MDSAQEMSRIEFINAHRDARLEEHESKINKILLGINALLECDRENKEVLEKMNRKVKSCMDVVYSIEKQLAYDKGDQLERLIKLIPACFFFTLVTVGFSFAAIRFFSYYFS